MFDQKAIAIPRDWGLQAFADAVEATLEELATERWDSRIFQLGPAGLLIVARRPRTVELEDPTDMMDPPDWMGDDGDLEEPDDLEPSTREMLDKIFDLVGPVPLDIALDGMSSAQCLVSHVCILSASSKTPGRNCSSTTSCTCASMTMVRRVSTHRLSVPCSMPCARVCGTA